MRIELVNGTGGLKIPDWYDGSSLRTRTCQLDEAINTVWMPHLYCLATVNGQRKGRMVVDLRLGTCTQRDYYPDIGDFC